MILAASLALCSAFQAPASAMRASQLPAATMSPVRASPLMMAEEPSDKAVVIGAAAVGGIAGVYLFGDLGTSARTRRVLPRRSVLLAAGLPLAECRHFRRHEPKPFPVRGRRRRPRGPSESHAPARFKLAAAAFGARHQHHLAD